jgi:hypothetical protein
VGLSALQGRFEALLTDHALRAYAFGYRFAFVAFIFSLAGFR